MQAFVLSFPEFSLLENTISQHNKVSVIDIKTFLNFGDVLAGEFGGLILPEMFWNG